MTHTLSPIKEKCFKEIFYFTPLTTEEVLSEFDKLDHTKYPTGNSINLFKDNSNICAPILTNILNIVLHQKRSFSGSTEIS